MRRTDLRAYGILNKRAAEEGVGGTVKKLFNFGINMFTNPADTFEKLRNKAGDVVDQFGNAVKSGRTLYNSYEETIKPLQAAYKNNDFKTVINMMTNNQHRKNIQEVLKYPKAVQRVGGDEALAQLNDLNTLFGPEQSARQVQALYELSENQNNQKWLMSPRGRWALSVSSAAINDQNNNVINWLAEKQPELHKQLTDNAGKINFAAKNYGSLQDMYHMQQNPLSWLLSALLNRDPSKLYDMVTNINNVYTPGTDMNKFLLPTAQDTFKQYQWTLPWLNGAANFRSFIAQDGREKFLTPSEQLISGAKEGSKS